MQNVSTQGILPLQMHLTIYFQQKPLYLTDTLTKEFKSLKQEQHVLYTDTISNSALSNLIQQIQCPESEAGIICYKDVPAALEAVKKQFTFLQAAGGLVTNEARELLLIFRRGKWDLPKGKLDEGETLETCAVREVREETGLNDVMIKEPLTITYHTYHQNGDFLLKESHWFFMQCSTHQDLVPQTDEDIEQCAWVKINELAPFLQNTHPSIADVLKEGIHHLQKTGTI